MLLTKSPTQIIEFLKENNVYENYLKDLKYEFSYNWSVYNNYAKGIYRADTIEPVAWKSEWRDVNANCKDWYYDNSDQRHEYDYDDDNDDYYDDDDDE